MQYNLSGIWELIDMNSHSPSKKEKERVSQLEKIEKEIKAAKEILSSLGLIKKPLLISCPTCGRTQYDMLPILSEIEKFI